MAQRHQFLSGGQGRAILPGASSVARRRGRLLRVVGLSAVLLGGAGWWVAQNFWCAPRGGPFLVPVPATSSGVVDDAARRESRELADRIVRDFPESAQAIYARGVLLSMWGQGGEAVKCWEAALKLDPGLAPAYRQMGMYALTHGDFQRAVSLLRRAMELDPSAAEVSLQLALALLATDSPEEAIGVLRRHVARWPRSPEAYYRLGQASLQVGALDQAKEYYEASLRIDPTALRVYIGLATACTRLGETEKAREYHKKIRELSKADRAEERRRNRAYDDGADAQQEMANEYMYVGAIYREHGRAQEALECLQKAAAVAPKHVPSRKTLVTLLEQQNKIPEAIGVLEELRQIEPQDPVHCVKLGALRLRLNELDAAEAAFRKAIDVAPKRSEGYVAAALFCLQTGRKLPEARALAQKAVELDPTPANYFLLGLACFRNGDSPAALTAIRRAMDLDPGSSRYREAYQEIQQKSSKAKP
jgi:tetratricopeptide (TPR) repeat protein